MPPKGTRAATPAAPLTDEQRLEIDRICQRTAIASWKAASIASDVGASRQAVAAYLKAERRRLCAARAVHYAAQTGQYEREIARMSAEGYDEGAALAVARQSAVQAHASIMVTVRDAMASASSVRDVAALSRIVKEQVEVGDRLAGKDGDVQSSAYDRLISIVTAGGTRFDPPLSEGSALPGRGEDDDTGGLVP